MGVASFADGALAGGRVTITMPTNIKHVPTKRPIFSSQMSKPFVDGEVSFELCPTDADGLNNKTWVYKANIVIDGALVQPDPIYFPLPTAGPDTVDLDGLETVPSSSGLPISVDVLTTEDLPGHIEDYFAENPPIPTGGAGGALSGSYPNPGLNASAVDELVAARIEDTTSDTALALRAAFGRAAPVLSEFVYDPPTGNLLSYKEDGIPIVLTYNADGTVATSKRGAEATQTFTYSGGNLAGVA